MEHKNLLMGIWKFRDRLPREELAKLAEEWAEDPNYLQLYIRTTATDERGIGFTYDVGDADSDSVMDAYVEKMSDELRRKFGNDLKGWDVSSAVTFIK